MRPRRPRGVDANNLCGDRRLRRWLSIPDGVSIHILSTNAIDLPEI